MRTIRFSYPDYEKFQKIHKRPPFTATLLQVFLLQNDDVSEWFREYDTKYYTEKGADYYPLQGSRSWIVLLFETDGLLFTTMRSATTSKLQYYKDSQGEEFEIVTTAKNAHRYTVQESNNDEKDLPPGKHQI
jgi:hypothetical protein